MFPYTIRTDKLIHFFDLNKGENKVKEKVVIRLIYELCLDGYSLSQIKEILNAQNVPFPALLYRREKPEWYRVAISNVLSDKDNISKGYVSEHEYEIVQRLLLMNNRVRSNRLEVLPLIGIAYCKECNSLMVERGKSSRGRTYEYYMCGNNKRTKACTPHMTPAGELERKVLEWMKDNIPDSDLKMEVKLKREKCIEYLDKVYVDKDGVVEIIPITR